MYTFYKQNLTKRLRLLLIILLPVLYYQCTDDKNELLPDKDYRIGAPQKGVYPHEAFSLLIKDFDGLNESYEGTFGGIPVQFSRGSDSTLVFLIPGEASEGKQTLTIALNSHQKEVQFSVLKAVDVTNPDQLLTGILTEANKLIESEKENPGLEGNMTVLKEWVSEYEKVLGSLTDGQKKEVAAILAVNAPLEEDIEMAAGRYDWHCFGNNSTYFLKALVLTTADITSLGILAGIPPNPLSIAAGVALTIRLISNVSKVKNRAMSLMDCSLLRDFGFNLPNLRTGESPDFGFSSGVNATIKLMAHYKPLHKADAQSGNELIREVVDSINKFTGYWNEAKKVIDKIKSAFGIGADNLPNEQPQALEDDPASETLPLVAGNISLENISNERVKLEKSTASEEGVLANFTNKSLTAQEFTFDIRITDGEIELKKTFSATISPEEAVLSLENEAGLTAIPGEDLPIQVKASTKSGQPIVGATVAFEVKAGRASVSAAFVETNGEGLASVSIAVAENNEDNIQLKVFLLDDAGGRVAEHELTIENKPASEAIEGWYVGQYTLDGNNIKGDQTGEKGDVYFYIEIVDKGSSRERLHIAYYFRSILAGLPNIYFRVYFDKTTRFFDPDSWGYKSFALIWQDRTVTDRNSRDYLGRYVSLGSMTIIDGESITTRDESNSGLAYIQGPNGSLPESFDYKFHYNRISVSAKYVGSAPPSDLKQENLDRMRAFLGNLTESFYIEE